MPRVVCVQALRLCPIRTMSCKPSVRIAVAGFSGRIGVRHTQYVLDHAEAQLAALVDPGPTAASTAARLAPNTPFFASVSDMLEQMGHGRPDAAIVAVPNHLHVRVAKEFVSAGISILVEKPLCDNEEDGRALLDLVKAKGVKLLVGHHKRFNHYVMAVAETLRSRALGDITAVSALWTGYKPDSYYEVPWRRSKSSGGGPVLNNLVHDVDLLHHFFGPIVKVHAEKAITRRRHDDKQPGQPDQAEEGLALTLRFASGIVGTFTVSDTVASPMNFENSTGDDPGCPQTWFDEPTKQEVDCYRIFGTEASLSFPDMTKWYFGDRQKSWESVLIKEKLPVVDDGRWPFERRLDHFVAVARGEVEPNCSGEDGLRAVLVCDAIRNAVDSETGTVFVRQID